MEMGGSGRPPAHLGSREQKTFDEKEKPMRQAKLFALTLALVLSTLVHAAPGYNDRRYDIQIRDQQSMGSHANPITDSVYVIVYDAGTKTLSTIYADKLRTAKTNPISRSQFATDDAIKFYSASASHDIVFAHSDGSVGFKAGVTPNTHQLYLDRTGSDKTLIVPFSASDNTETDTGVDLPYGALVYDAAVEVVTVDATETIDVGLLSSETAGDADGLLVGVSVATAGIPARATYTTGSNETYLSAVTYGALLKAVSLGNDVATDVGSFARLTHYVTGSNAKSVTYTGSAGSDTAAGYIYVFFKHLR
jgi:hypothetical protein